MSAEQAIPLCQENLSRLPARVSVPAYSRSALSPGVVHLSVGSFHRSHQAVYFDALARRGERDWGIVGIGLRRPRLRAALAPQDGLYTVVARGAGDDEARVIGAMTSYLLAPSDQEVALAALADPRTALVTLTITASAYALDAPAEPHAWPRGLDSAPSSALAYVVEALDRRRRRGVAPFTVLSCDNLPDNGTVAREALVTCAARRDARLAAWIEANVEFPNSMVDRITPQTSLADREMVARDFGVLDRWPVITEQFSQWLVQERFCNRRPPLDEVGVQFVDDVTPYALMKTRLLNASHCAIGFLGSLAGLRRADEVMRDPVFSRYVLQLMRAEVAPLLPRVAGIDLASYTSTLIERLSNPKIADELERLCRGGSSKVPTHVLPSIECARDRGSEHRLLTMAVAGWFRYLRGSDERGRPTALDDPLATELRAAALRGGSDPRPLLSRCSGFEKLADDPGFVTALETALVALDRDGARAAVASRLAHGGLAA